MNKYFNPLNNVLIQYILSLKEIVYIIQINSINVYIHMDVL